jgi:hypothetical protein
MQPFGFPDADPDAPTRLAGAELREAQACLPRASDVREFRNPIITLTVLRRMHNLSLEGQPVAPLKPQMQAYMDAEARKLDINPQALPPARIGH